VTQPAKEAKLVEQNLNGKQNNVLVEDKIIKNLRQDPLGQIRMLTKGRKRYRYSRCAAY